MAKTVTYYGNEPFREFIAPETGQAVRLTYWDLWFMVVLLNEFEGDWANLFNRFRQPGVAPAAYYKLEPMLNHARQLQQMLSEAGLSAAEALGDERDELLKTIQRKAHTKILKNPPPYRDMSPWMINTPRALREQRALRGHWLNFPVSPEKYALPFARLFKRDVYSASATFKLEEKLTAFVDRYDQEEAASDEVAALYRAVMTVILEKIEQIDDSYGTIGDFFGNIFTGYTELPRAELSITPTDFFEDLLELLIWEDYGFTHFELPHFFAGLSPDEALLAAEILRRQRSELLQEDFMAYQAEKALTLLGRLSTQQKWLDRLVDLAAEMGSRHWERITTMAELAEQQQRPDLAAAIFEAALAEPGMHQDFLKKKYQEFTARTG